jgi:hypothetical protein
MSTYGIITGGFIFHQSAEKNLKWQHIQWDQSVPPFSPNRVTTRWVPRSKADHDVFSIAPKNWD